MSVSKSHRTTPPAALALVLLAIKTFTGSNLFNTSDMKPRQDSAYNWRPAAKVVCVAELSVSAIDV